MRKIELQKKLTDLQSVINEYESYDNAELPFKLKIYAIMLTHGIQNTSVTTILKLKEIDAIISQGNFATAKNKLVEMEAMALPVECAEYLSSLRLTLELSENSEVLFKRN